MAPSMDDFNAERDRLRAECSSLYDQKRAIESRMEEVQERLMWLDDRIDGSGDDEDDDNVQDEDDGDMQQPPMMARKYGAHVASFTQAEDYLTDPHTQTQTIDDDEERPKSPPTMTTNRTLQSKTPPGLKSSTAASNPFNDLRPPLARLSDVAGKRKRGEGGGGMNTLEKYFVGATGPPSNPYSDSIVESGQRVRAEAGTLGSAITHKDMRMPTTAAARGGMALSDNSNIGPQLYQRSRRPWTDAMMRHLRQTFRIQEFRDNQEAIIDTTMRGEDCFVVMRTGGGKSLTYQLPAILECFETNGAPRKVTVVISPLISLICDQEEQMNGFYRGSAISFTSGLAGGNTEHTRRWGLVRDGDGGVAMIFVTPEKVGQSNKFKGEMERLNNQGRLGRFVIDECHCASQWGHDFRPDYAKLGILKHHFPHIPVLAVTATASERARHDCAQILRLSLGKYKFYRSSANRPNLNYSVRCKPETKEGVVKDIVAYIKENNKGESGIIYTFSKKEANEVAKGLCSNGIIAKPYHGDVKDATKTQVQRSWMNNKTQVVVATIAFGLGINKPDVRFVLHHSLSKSLEAYYQESGRAGRDGSPANCVLYYSPKDIPRLLKMVHGDAGEASFWSMARYSQAHGDDALCRHIILATLGEADDNMGMTLVNLQNACTSTVQRDIGAHCQTAAKVVNTMNLSGEDCTLNQIVTKWRSKSFEDDFSFLKDNPPKDLSKEGEQGHRIFFGMCYQSST